MGEVGGVGPLGVLPGQIVAGDVQLAHAVRADACIGDGTGIG